MNSHPVLLNPLNQSMKSLNLTRMSTQVAISHPVKILKNSGVLICLWYLKQRSSYGYCYRKCSIKQHQVWGMDSLWVDPWMRLYITLCKEMVLGQHPNSHNVNYKLLWLRLTLRFWRVHHCLNLQVPFMLFSYE